MTTDDLEMPEFLRRAADPPVKADDAAQSTTEAPCGLDVPGLRWMRIYWNAGDIRAARGKSAVANEVRDPPCSGWQHALVLDEVGNKLITIFCPYSLRAFRVSARSAEIASAIDVTAEARPQVILKIMRDRWGTASRHGLKIDLDVARIMFALLGGNAPPRVPSKTAMVAEPFLAAAQVRVAAGERAFVRTLGVKPLSDIERKTMRLGPKLAGNWYPVLAARPGSAAGNGGRKHRNAGKADKSKLAKSRSAGRARVRKHRARKKAEPVPA